MVVKLCSGQYCAPVSVLLAMLVLDVAEIAPLTVDEVGIGGVVTAPAVVSNLLSSEMDR